jgi:hypothetical protein
MQTTEGFGCKALYGHQKPQSIWNLRFKWDSTQNRIDPSFGALNLSGITISIGDLPIVTITTMPSLY